MYKTFTGNEGNRNGAGDLVYGLIVQRAILQQAVTVLNTPTPLPATALSYRKSLQIFNNSNNPVFIGNSAVTTADGFPLYPRGVMNIQIEDGITIYAISAAGGDEVRILEGA